MILKDLKQLARKYVPMKSRHDSATHRRFAGWWSAHELGHLLTVPKKWIGLPWFGMDIDIPSHHPQFDLWSAYELAAMDVSRRLLESVGQEKLYLEEANGTDTVITELGNKDLAQQILRRRHVLRLPRDRNGLESFICRRLT